MKFSFCKTIQWILILGIIGVLYHQHDDTIHEELHMDMSDICLKYGFLVKTYHVITEDGYILSLFRLIDIKIPHDPYSEDEKSEGYSIKSNDIGKPVLFVHGLN